MLQYFFVHSKIGGAVGCSSVLLIIPTSKQPDAEKTNDVEKQPAAEKSSEKKPVTKIQESHAVAKEPEAEGIVIAIIANMQSVGLLKTAEKLGDTLLEVVH